MKKKFLSFILSVLTVCVAFGAFGGCSLGGGKSSSSGDSMGTQEPSWEDEIVEDQEYGDIELPEVERP